MVKFMDYKDNVAAMALKVEGFIKLKTLTELAIFIANRLFLYLEETS
jgi:hypothetical protein